MNNRTQKWLDAAMKLAENKEDQVLCPSCLNSFLLVKDEPINQWRKIDRYLICESCDEYNVIAGNFKDSDFYFTDSVDTL